MDGAAVPAGGGEAVDEGHLLLQLAAGDGLHGLAIVPVGGDGLHQGGGPGRIHADPGGVVDVRQGVGDLVEPLIAAGLEDGGGHGDGPDARVVQLPHRVDVRAAGVGDAQLALELAGQPGGQGQGQRVEGPAGHVHLLAGQLPGLHIHREGVGDLYAELQPPLPGELHQPVEHGHRVLPLEILQEVVVVKGDVVVAQAVQGLAGELVAQQGGVALDVGVQVLLGDQIGGDALDLVGGAAVEGGLGDGVGNMGGDGLHIGLVHLLKFVQVGQGPVHARLPHLGVRGVLHPLDVGVHLGALDALEIVAHAHVEHEAVGVAQLQLPGQQLAGKPRLHILGERLRHGELGRPLAVVALVGGGDAGLADALGQLLAVHDLHGLDLEEPAASGVGGHDVLGQLGVGAGGGAEGGLDLLVKDGQGLPVPPAGQLGHAEDGLGGAVLAQNPVHQVGKGHGSHNIAHGETSISIRWAGQHVRPPCVGRGLAPAAGKKGSIGSVVQFTPQLFGLLHAEGVDFAPPGGPGGGPQEILSARGE